MGNGIWRSGREILPRGYSGATLDLASPNARGTWSGKTYAEPLSHGRVFTKEEIWENYTYFIKKVVPVPRKQVCASVSTLTTRHNRCWPAYHAASSRT